MFTPQGPAGIFALYAPAGSKLGQVFLNEFVCVCRRRTLGYTTPTDAPTCVLAGLFDRSRHLVMPGPHQLHGSPICRSMDCRLLLVRLLPDFLLTRVADALFSGMCVWGYAAVGRKSLLRHSLLRHC